jgi:hypothetical protein
MPHRTPIDAARCARSGRQDTDADTKADRPLPANTAQVLNVIDVPTTIIRVMFWFAAAPVVAMFGWWRWPFDPTVPATPITTSTKTEGTVPRATLNGHHPPPRLVTLPEEVVLRAIDIGRPAFVQCFKRAIQVGTTFSFKIRVRIEFDATGTSRPAHRRGDTRARQLSAPCGVQPAVRFAARPAVAEFPLSRVVA